MDKIFRKHNLNLGHLAAIAKLEEPAKLFRRIKPGDEFEIVHEDGNIVSMHSILGLSSALEVDHGEEGFKATIIERPVEVRKRIAHGVIDSSLFMAGADAGLSDKVIMNIAGIFAWDVDFVLDIRQGDNFLVQYEEIWQDGSYVTDGEIIAAEFNNDGDTYRAVRFIDEEGLFRLLHAGGRERAQGVHPCACGLLADQLELQSQSASPDSQHHPRSPRRRLRGAQGHTDQSRGRRKSHIPRRQRRLWQHGHPATRRQHHDLVCPYVEFRGESQCRHASSPGADHRLRGRHGTRHGQPPALRVPVERCTSQSAHGAAAESRTDRRKYRDAFLSSVPEILAELEQFKRTQLAAAVSATN